MTMPRPIVETRNVTCALVNVAVTGMSLFTGTEQVDAPPTQGPPDQPEKVDPGSGVAVKVTVWPWRNSAEHAEPQSTARVPSCTRPEPVPAFCTVTRRAGTTYVWKKKSASA